MRKEIRNENPTGEAIKEKKTVYFTCHVNLLKEFEEISKLAGYLSKEEAIRQSMREFLQNNTPEYVTAARNTEAATATMVQMYEKYPNFPSMLAALKAQSAARF
jgi:metal-responsive CopG/Arc/MetJ family transcriptional regulator